MKSAAESLRYIRLAIVVALGVLASGCGQKSGSVVQTTPKAETQPGDVMYFQHRVSEWLERAKSDDTVVAEQARTLLPGLSRDPDSARKAIPILIDALTDNDARVRMLAASTLANIRRDDAVAAVPRLLERLDSENSAEQVAVARALWRIDRHSRAIPTLCDALKVSEVEARIAAIQALGEIGSAAKTALPPLLEIVKDPQAQVRTAVASALARIHGDSEAVIAAQVGLLSDADDGVRTRAAANLGALGAKAAVAVPKLMAALQDAIEESTSVSAIATSLGQIGPAASPAIPALIGIMRAGDERQRSVARDALRRIGPAIIPEMTRLLLADDSPYVRLYAAQSIAGFARESPEVAAAYVKALDDSDDQIRLHAALPLLQNGSIEQIRIAVAVLIRLATGGLYREAASSALVERANNTAVYVGEALAKSDAAARVALSKLLVEMGVKAKPAANAMKNALNDDVAEVRLYIAKSLLRIGDSQTAISALIGLVKIDDLQLRLAAIEELGAAGPAAVSCESDLANILKTGAEANVRAAAAQTLARIQAKSKSSIDCLSDALADASPYVRLSAAAAIGALASQAQSALPQLIAVLKDENASVRAAAAKSLGQFGPAANDASQELKQATNDARREVRDSATAALKLIGSQ